MVSELLESPAGSFTAAHVSSRLLIQQIDGSDQYFIFNPLSGALDLADSDDVELLQALQSGAVDARKMDPAFLKHLFERKIAFPSLDAEEDYLEQSVARARANCGLKTPNMYTVCPTLACNLACGYCFEGDSLLDKKQGVMSDLQLECLFTAIDELEAERTRRIGDENVEQMPSWIALFGGEPLLPSTRACVHKILEYASDRGFYVGATTNGVNIRHFESLLKEYKDILGSFQITLDGPRDVHNSRRHRLGGQGTFDEIVAGIEVLLGLNVALDLRVNTDSSNIDSIPELCEFIESRGWMDHPSNLVQVAIAPVTMHSPGTGCGSSYNYALSELEIHKRLLDLVERFSVVGRVCRLGHLRHLDHLSGILEPEYARLRRDRSGGPPGPRYWYCEQGTGQQWVFTPDGHIYTCTEAVGKVSHAIGRFEPQFELAEAAAQSWFGRTILSHTKCRSCKISTLCGGGCHFAAREKAATPAEPKLLQISLRPTSRSGSDFAGGSQTRLPSGAESKTVPDTLSAAAIDPYCSQAEEIVRAYLSHMGRRLAA